MSDWLDADRKNIWHPFTSLHAPDPVLIKKAKGAYIFPEKGEPILDAVSSWWVNIHGHANDKIATAIAKQARKMEQVIFAGFTHKPAIKLSKKLLEILPDDQSRIFFSDDGSTSTEVAIKLAIQYWHNIGKPRKKIIALEGAYHGDTFGAMAIGSRSMFTSPFNSHLFDVEFIPFPEGDGSNSIKAMEEIAGIDTAAFIFEPLVQGAGGMRIYDKEILDGLIETARRKDIICIADEVMTGFGRTGEIFSCRHLKNDPDIFCLSKGLTGGFLPMGITTANKKIESAFDSDNKMDTFYHGHSYTANPIACAAAIASMKITKSEKTRLKIEAISKAHEQLLPILSAHKMVKHAKSLGTILSLEVNTSDSGYTSGIRDKIYDHFMSKNILLRPLGNVIYMLPPYVISLEDLARVHQEILDFLDSISHQ